MGELKHSKHKNTGIIFELLSRQIVSDILCENKSDALTIVKRLFKKGSELSKELTLYRSLLEFNKKDKITAAKFLDLVLEQRKKLNTDQLRKERYKLLGEIKKAFKEDVFFTSRLSNYKMLASIYKLFEHSAAFSPAQYINNYEIVLEGIINHPNDQTINSDTLKIWENQTPEVKKLAFNLILGKFNDKYKVLNSRQKILISKYINENSDTPNFKDYIIGECSYITKALAKINTSITDKTLNIKINEVSSLINEIITSKFIKEEHLTALLSYYELVELLKGK